MHATHAYVCARVRAGGRCHVPQQLNEDYDAAHRYKVEIDTLTAELAAARAVADEA
jgi:hypothetical protein